MFGQPTLFGSRTESQERLMKIWPGVWAFDMRGVDEKIREILHKEGSADEDSTSMTVDGITIDRFDV
jgi:hypothetical protein